MKNNMKGVWTALITPFNEKDELDTDEFKRLVTIQCRSKITGIVPCGTTGEAPVLKEAEKEFIIKSSVQIAKMYGKQVMTGTGTNNTEKTISNTIQAFALGTDSALVVTPYYNRPTQPGLIRHYEKVADASPGPLVLYNVPGRSGVSLSLSTVESLAEHPKIIGIKDASGDLGFLTEVLIATQNKKKKFSVFTGDDPLFLSSLAVGAHGIISVASNVMPNWVADLQMWYEAGKIKKCQTEFQKAYPLLRDLFIESNPAPIKFLMKKVHGFSEKPRLPLVSLSSKSQAILLKEWKQQSKRRI